MRAKAIVAAIAVVAIAVVIALVRDARPRFPPTTFRYEGIAGFAIWPDDQPESAFENCRALKNDEPWRTDPDEVATRFQTDVLGWREPDDYDQYTGEEKGRTGKTLVDGRMPRWALGIVVQMERLEDCWYIVSVQPRDGDVAAFVDFNRDGEMLTVRIGRTDKPLAVEVGYGPEIEREILDSGEEMTVPIPGPDAFGHVLVMSTKQPSSFIWGRVLGPPSEAD